MSQLFVVMYHYVRELKGSAYPALKALELSDFEKQITFLTKNYNVVTMEMVLAHLHQGEALPKYPVLLTFDDGYIDHYDNVLPILSKYKIQGSFYVPVSTVTENVVLDVNKIHIILACIQDKNKLVMKIRDYIECYREEYQLRSFQEYYDKYANPFMYDTAEVIFIKRMLQVALPEPLRMLITSEMFNDSTDVDEATFSKMLYMDAKQIKTLVSAGMHIGCHGYNHYWWNSLTKESLLKEINLSLDFLDSVGMDMDNWTACYPYGSYNDTVLSILLEKKCKFAATTEPRIASLKSDSFLTIPRVDTNDVSKHYFG